MTQLNAQAQRKPLLRMTHVTKTFGRTRALKGVSFDVMPGEVHALVGENGAGKSTLMKVLSGVHTADSGAMSWEDAPYRPAGPMDARRRGIAMIYQELNLLPHLSVEANIMLGREVHRFGVVDKAAHRKKARQALALIGRTELHPDTPLERLSVGAQQLVEVARALAFDARLIIFDEPTSALAIQDADRLFAVIRRLRAQGAGIVYISHFLEEVLAVADRYTVLRDGESVKSGDVAGASADEIIKHMVGRKVTELYPKQQQQPGTVLLSADKVSGFDMPKEASFELRAGEILGIAGLMGAGRTELLRAIFGLDRIRSGAVTARAVRLERCTPKCSINAGLGFLSENRKEEGLAVRLSIADNCTLSHLKPLSRFGWLSLKQQLRSVSVWLEKLGIRSTGPLQAVQTLSGGNQQKVAIARLLHQEADIFLFDEPTRGVDVASKAQIYGLLGELAAQGKAILFVSSYLPELFGICDQLAVMTKGRLSSIRPINEWTETDVMTYATSSTKEQSQNK